MRLEHHHLMIQTHPTYREPGTKKNRASISLLRPLVHTQDARSSTVSGHTQC